MNNIVKGKKGEILAKKFLKKNKYKILQTNYKNVLGEIDIVATKSGVIVFVEVKFRTTQKYGLPREAVTPQKASKIRHVATLYLQAKRLLESNIRFDVLDRKSVV